jgi:hypothetical protein
MENTKTSKMENQENEKISKVSYKKSRAQMIDDTVGMTEEQYDGYISERAKEFYDKYDFMAQPSQTAKILVKPSAKALQSEFDVFLAQKEQYMKYMGCHTAETFGHAIKPTELLKEFGQWLVDTADHADWDYEDGYY